MDEHDDYMVETYGPHVGTYVFKPGFCGEARPHAAHDECLGIMCDYGCNAEDF